MSPEYSVTGIYLSPEYTYTGIYPSSTLKVREMPLSKTQIDRLGDRLKAGSHTEKDLRLLDDYRGSFGEAYETVLRKIRERGEFPTGRLAKSTRSIVEKLRRESIRLSQMQDIAGCRVVVKNIVQQDQLVASLATDFMGASIIDRRNNPSYGYRAVHIIATISGEPVEIQVRTELQHLWAELSEKSSDVLDPTIKYGGGSAAWRNLLTIASEAVAAYEAAEKTFSETVASGKETVAAHEKATKVVADLLEKRATEPKVQVMRGMLDDVTRGMVHLEQEEQRIREEMARRWNGTTNVLKKIISWLDKQKRKKQ